MAYSCLMLIIYPIRSSPSNNGMVASRVTSFVLLFASLIFVTVSIVLRGWKIEGYLDELIEISLWTICRYALGSSRELNFNKCYGAYYAKQPFHAWFECWRFFLVLASAILVFTFLFMCYEQSFKNDDVKKPWSSAAIASLLSAFFTGSSLALYWYEYSFDFLEESFRWAKMGWTEFTTDKEGFVEKTGPPLMLCVVSFFLMLITSYSCYVTKCCEELKLKSCSSNDVRENVSDEYL